MNVFHSTLSRREFMKGLSLTGAGIGAAAAMAPAFHDLDELSGSSKSQQPWWVKERDFNNPTVEIDWTTFKPYDKTKNPFYTKPADIVAKLAARDTPDKEESYAKKIPGRSLRDQAFSNGSSFNGPDAPWDGPTNGSLPVEAKGVAWQDTPENNLQMMRAALRAYGAVLTGAIVVDDKNKNIFDAAGFVFDSSTSGSQDAQKIYHIPDKCKYMLTFAVKQNYLQSTYQIRADATSPTGLGVSLPLGAQAVGQAYSNSSYVGYSAMRMVKTLGWQTYKTGVTANVPLGVFSGLGESARNSHLNTPRYGLMVRYTNYFFTDMPLAPTPPIDAGMFDFCATCMRCGEFCPSSSLSKQKDPTWDTAGVWNRPGFKGYFMGWKGCIDNGGPGACGICHTNCPFNHPAEGVIHPTVRSIAATTPVFNSFFASMDKSFGYGKPRSDQELADWWTRDLYKAEIDTSLGTGKQSW